MAQTMSRNNNKGSGVFLLILVLGIIALISILSIRNIFSDEDTVLEYNNQSELITDIENGLIYEITFEPISSYDQQYHVTGTFINPRNHVVTDEDGNTTTVEKDSFYFKLNTTQDRIDIIEAVEGTSIKINTLTPSTFSFWSLLMSFLPIIILIVIIIYFVKSGGGTQKGMEFGKSKAKLSHGKSVTFKDVAGNDEEKFEMEEIIDFLKNPAKYREIGARIPKGVLLSGPPGTGKTLLAKAVAGEANVPFFSISGSDFVEMYVGIGASRVRDMFKTAKMNAPCIVFIDEIDAVGSKRGTGVGGSSDEREQTLNQLLTEMDGFGSNSGIIIVAATNRPEVLDNALLRPGRFDRQITINRPDIKGREAILKVHARNKKMIKDIKLNEVASRIPGFSGADIENLLNEAALLAARDNRKQITLPDIDEAVDRVLMGPAKKSKVYSKQERQLVAHHEAGHVVIGVKLDNATIVQKVTIIPRGKAGGYALMLPDEEKFLETKNSLTDRITGLLGGRVAEELMFNEGSTGAHHDFQVATGIARSMVTEYGMSNLGPIQFEQRNGSEYLGYGQNTKNFSDSVALDIDNEVKRIIEECYTNATKVIKNNLELLKTIATYLLEVETLTKQEIDEIVETGKLKWWDDKKLAQKDDKSEKPKTPKKTEATT